jgi:hypothetical protein
MHYYIVPINHPTYTHGVYAQNKLVRDSRLVFTGNFTACVLERLTLTQSKVIPRIQPKAKGNRVR